MSRNRYLITQPDRSHFLTYTVVEWLPVFACPETVEIVLDCWRFQRENKGVRPYDYDAPENHCHYSLNPLILR